MIRSETGGHNNLGRRQFLAVRQGGKKTDYHYIICGGTGSEQAAAQHYNKNHQDKSLESAFIGHIEHGPFKGCDKTGFLQSCDDCHEFSKHNNGGIGKSGKGRLDISNAEYDEQKTG